jgi:hypothetical protein
MTPWRANAGKRRTLPRARRYAGSAPLAGRGFVDGGHEGGAQSGELLEGDLALSEVGRASAAKAELREGFFEEAAAVEAEVEAARQDDGGGFGAFGAEEDDGGGSGCGETGGEQAAILGVAILPEAVDNAETVFDLDFDGETRGVVVGELFAETLAIF